MAVTRIKNNQITDATVVANAKLVDYSISSAKLANNLTYNSNFTVTGNLTVQGNTTTIDTTITTIEDPVIVLASTQTTGTPVVDIGYLGYRGDQSNIAFVWDESASEFVTVFTSSGETNTVVTITSYANFHTNDANIGGNIVINGTTSMVGNLLSANVTGTLNAGNILTPGIVSATGTVTGGNVATAGTISATGDITGGNVATAGTVSAAGTVTGGNLATAGTITATGTITSADTITGGNIATAGTVSATGTVTGGNILTAGLVSATGNVTGGNILFGTGIVSGTGNIYANNIFANISGNIDAAGSNTQVQYNENDLLAASAAFTFNPLANVLTVTGPIVGNEFSTSGTITATGTVTGGNVLTGGLVSAAGNVTGGNFDTAGQVSATGTITGGNVATGGLITAAGNVTGGNVLTSGLVSAGGTITATDTITGGNLATAGTVTATGTITGGNVLTGGIVSATSTITGGNILTAGEVSATGSLTGGNVFTGGAVSATSDVTGGNLVTGGQVTATGTITGGNVVTGGFVSATGTVTGGNVATTGTVSATGDVTGGNLVTGGAVTATGTVTGGNVATGGTVSATGTVTGGNVATGGTVSATGNVTGGNITTAGAITATGNITGNYFIGNGSLLTGIDTTLIQNGNTNVQAYANGNVAVTVAGVSNTVVFTTTGVNIAGTASATGDVTGQNLLTGGNVSAVGFVTTSAVNSPSVTAATSLALNAANGNVTLTAGGGGNIILGGGHFINNVNNPLQAQDAATKQYVDDAVSTGIHIHTPVYVETPVALPSATYVQGGTTASVSATVAGNTVVFSSAISPQVNDQYWFANSFNGIVANTAYFVVSAPNTSAAVLSLAYNGAPVTNITSGTGLTESLRINSGVGATLTATANGALTIDSVSVSNTQRVLVYQQANAVQNGVYVVSDAGNVSAPWVLTRATDADRDIPNDNTGLDQGSYFYVQAGATGAGESYVMTNPAGAFIIGFANIEFTQFSASQVYSANTAAGLSLIGTVFNAKVDENTTAFDGNGNIIVKAGANLTTPNIGAATGTSLSVTGNIDGGNVFTGGAVSATGNITGNFFIGNGSQLTGVTATSVDAGNLTGNTLSSNVVFSSLTTVGNLTNLSVVGNTVTGNLSTAGFVSATGTVTGGNIDTAGAVSATGTITGGNVATAGTVSATGTVTGGNVLTGGIVSATGNITGADITGSNVYTTGLVTATGNITGGNLITGGTITATGTVTGGNVLTAGEVSAGGTLTGGNVLTGGIISATSTITGGNIATAGTITATGNVDGGNFNTGGQVNATGTVTGGNLVTGGLITATGNISTAANISGGNILFGSGIVSGTGNIYADTIFANIAGNIDAAGNINEVQFNGAGDLLAASAGFTFDPAANLLTVTGNVSGGNVLTAGLISATGTVTGGNIATAGTVSATGNITGGNIDTAGQVSATGNITASFFLGNGSQLTGIDATSIQNGNSNVRVAANANVTVGVAGTSNVAVFADTGIYVTGVASATGTITGGNIATAGTITATGNITGGNLILTGAALDTSATSLIVNSTLADADFAVNGDTVANVFYVDAGTNSASFGGSGQITNAIVNFATTTSIKVPVGNTVQRPGTGATGMVRFNTTLNKLELYDNSQWSTVGDTQFTVIDDQQFNGDGSTVVFTLSTPQTTNSCIVSINGVVQAPIIAYAVTGTTLTFTEAPETGDLIDVRQITTTTTVVAISNDSGNAEISVNDTTNIVYVTGQLSVSGGIIGNTGINSTQILNGSSGVNVVSAGGNIVSTVAGSALQTMSAGLIGVTGAISATGNVTSNFFIGNGSQLTGLPAGYTNSDAASFLAAFGSNTISTTGTVTSGNITGSNLFTAGVVSAAGNVRGGNINTAGTVSATGDVFGANAVFAGNLTVNGNITYINSNVVTISDLAINLANNAANVSQVNNGGIELGPQGSPFVTFLYNSSSNAMVSSAGLSATANVTGANLLTGGIVSATGNITGGNLSVGTGTVTVGNIINANGNGVGNIGSSSNYFNTVFAQSTSAQYADLAEKYTADAEYAPGTVVMFGGEAEVTVCSADGCKRVAGVISTNPSYIMNGTLEAAHVATVALTGRVPCRVIGTVRKGDLMVSAGNGTARAEENPSVGTVIGKALADHDGAEGVIEVVVGRF
jgi:fibronectin-binding autotransporter adhesin